MGEAEAVILDLDGVVTRTAALHARAWKRIFDAFLERRVEGEGENLAEFDIETDYPRHVDGKPRYDGVRDFLASRGIALPEGDPEDGPGAETVHGLGNRKNEVFLEMLREGGVETYADAVERLRRWRRRGTGIALVTSSRNGRAVAEAAGVRGLFDVVIDGVDAGRLGLRGKPAPDIFLEAARRLGVEPRNAMVVEDAIAGVEAGRAGGFALVVGVDRDGGGVLRDHGADLVVRDLREIDDAASARDRRSSTPASALDRLERIAGRADRRRRPPS